MSQPAPVHTSIDWAELRRRVEAVGRAVTGDTDLPPEQVIKILEQRARELARPPEASPAGDLLELITFELQGESCAIESRYVLEVLRLDGFALLPGVEAPVVGVAAWRGDLLTIIDLQQALGISAPALEGQRWALVLGKGEACFGVLVDVVHEVVRLPASAVQPWQDHGGEGRAYLRGITREAVLVLDAEKLLDSH